MHASLPRLRPVAVSLALIASCLHAQALEIQNGTPPASHSFSGYTLKVKLLDDGLSNAYYATVISSWEKHTGAKVKVVSFKPLAELDVEIRKDMANNEIDFCIASNHTSYSPLYESLYQNLLTLLPTAYLNHFDKRQVEMSKLDGSLVQLPRYADISAVYYNKSLYSSAENQAAYLTRYQVPLEPPQTWAELARQAKFFAHPPNMYGTLFAGKGEPLTGRFYEMLIAEGGQLVDSNLRPTFNSPAGLRALHYFIDLYGAGAVPKNTVDAGWSEIGAAFASGTIALNLDWPGWAGFYNDPKTSRLAGQVGIVRAPKGSSGKRTGWSGVHTYSITKHCDNTAAAVDFLMALSSHEAQLIEARQGKLVGRDDVAAEAIAEFKEKGNRYMTDIMTIFNAGMAEDSFTPPHTPAWLPLSDALWPELQKAIEGRISPEEALARAEKNAERALLGISLVN